MERVANFQSLLLHTSRSLLIKTKFHPYLNLSVNEPQSIVPQQGPMERDVPIPEPMVYSFIRLSEATLNELSYEIEGKQGHPPQSSKLTDGLHTIGSGLVSQVVR
jgi:hypothetical protein